MSLLSLPDASAGAADGHVVDGVEGFVALERGVAFLEKKKNIFDNLFNKFEKILYWARSVKMKANDAFWQYSKNDDNFDCSDALKHFENDVRIVIEDEWFNWDSKSSSHQLL